MPGPVYPIAQEIAQSIQPHLARHLAATGLSRSELPPMPGETVMAAIIDAAFWASLRREEGYVPRISLAFLPAGRSPSPLLFARPLPLVPDGLTRLAPAVERAGIHLGVWEEPDGIVVWGTTRTLPPYCFVLEVVSPGVLVLKHSPSDDSGKFANVAVLEGNKIKILAQHSPVPPGARDCPDHLHSVLEIGQSPLPNSPASILLQLAVSMRAHRRGGALLVVPNGPSNWLESMHSISYPVNPPLAELTELMRDGVPERAQWRWQRALRRAVDAVAGLTAVDGATVVTADYRVLAFGAKIRRRAKHPPVARVLLSEPVENSVAEIVEPAQLGGTRHLSAAQFVHDQRDAFALVASQDDHFTLFAWSACDELVHAHRIETLLM